MSGSLQADRSWRRSYFVPSVARLYHKRMSCPLKRQPSVSEASKRASDRNNGKFFLQAGFLITIRGSAKRNPQPTMDILAMNFDLDKDY
jgi:hypothetical protein